MAFGIVKVADFEKLKVTLSSEEHPIFKQSLSGSWNSQDIKWLSSTDDELFKIVARQKVN